jgi:uncharacterized lipoprotein YehR (DUF1307 family)
MKARTGLSLCVVASALILNLAGCGEKPTATVYKQGTYQGKPDHQPWDNDYYKSDKVAWDKAIKARNDAQNEYVRIGQ